MRVVSSSRAGELVVLFCWYEPYPKIRANTYCMLTIPMTVIVYFFMLLGTTVAHMHTYPLIWWSSVYSVPWFVSPMSNEPNTITQLESQSPPRPNTLSASSNKSHTSFIAIRYLRHRFSTKIDDVENISEPILFPRQSNGLPATQPTPGWAKKATTRRGVDMPFTREEGVLFPEETFELAAPQPRIAQTPRRGIDPPFATRMDGPTVPPAIYIKGNLPVPHFDTRSVSPLRRDLTVSPAFSQNVADQDSPIPLPKLSEWIRADPKRGRGSPR
jgi:hypothetical protein